MKRTCSFACLLTAALSTALVSAEPVEHHGIKADTEMSAEGCLACHDSTIGSSVSFCTVQCDFSTSHSIMKFYPPIGKRANFAPAEEVMRKGIRLDNGKITCISCHNLKNPERGHLVMDNRGSKLCLTCHIKF